MESGGGGGAGSALGLGGNSMSDDEFLFFDPKASARAGAAGNAPRPGRVSYQEAIVFMVGGGNYVEYQNLQELVKRQGSGKTITYGSTEILNAQAFLAQLAALSK